MAGRAELVWRHEPPSTARGEPGAATAAIRLEAKHSPEQMQLALLPTLFSLHYFCEKQTTCVDAISRPLGHSITHSNSRDCTASARLYASRSWRSFSARSVATPLE